MGFRDCGVLSDRQSLLAKSSTKGNACYLYNVVINSNPNLIKDKALGFRKSLPFRKWQRWNKLMKARNEVSSSGIVESRGLRSRLYHHVEQVTEVSRKFDIAHWRSRKRCCFEKVGCFHYLVCKFISLFWNSNHKVTQNNF